jgi:hypothetical protein
MLYFRKTTVRDKFRKWLLIALSGLIVRYEIFNIQFYESIGHWTTAVYVILVIHVLPVWLLSGVTLVRYPHHAQAILTGL